MWSDFKSINQEAWLVGASSDFERIGLKGLSSFVNYAEGRNAESIAGADLPDLNEFNVTADYKVDEGLLRGFWLRVRGSHLDYSGDTDSREERRVILNYEIPIL
jgi:predicted porin